MPFPNEVAARIAEPSQFEKFRRENGKFGPGIDVIWGIKGDKSEIQAVRFDAKKFTTEQAKAWLKEHKLTPIKVEPAAEASLHLVSYAMSDAIALSSVLEENGVPMQTFRKGIIRVGDWYVPRDDRGFSITQSDLQHWAQQFQLMKANGVQVPIPETHTDTPESIKPSDNRGWVDDMYVVGDELVANLKLIGTDGIALAHKSDVSIFSPVVYEDGKHNTYIRPITHVALCTNPVITGLSGWQASAASLTATNRKPEKKEPDMDPEVLKQLRTLLSLDASLDEKSTMTLALTKIKAMVDQKAKDDKEKDDLKDENKKCSYELQLALAAAPKTVKPNPMILKLSAENRKTKLAALVAGSHVTKAVADKLEGIYIGDKNASLELALSRGGDSLDPDGFDQVVAALSDNDPVVLGEQTGQQSVELSNDPAKRAENPLVKDAKQRRKGAGLKDE
jgi:hypothetical protein